jgi:hypothetical protein
MYYTITIPINEFHIENVILKDQTINKIIPNSTFCKVMYSTGDCHITGIPLQIQLPEFNNGIKYKYIIHKEKSKSILTQIQRIEEGVLQRYSQNITNKKPIFKLTSQLERGAIKINSDCSKSNLFTIKIIGIWETNDEYGITYRITNHL